MANISTENLENDDSKSGILDAVIESEQAHALADFDPDQLVSVLLEVLKDREREIVALRYGLADNQRHTLEAIGKKLNLTRERVRQIEKFSLKQLKKEDRSKGLNDALDLVRKTLSDHGGIFAQQALIDRLLISDKSERKINSLKFLLELAEHFNYLDETEKYHPSWHVPDFEIDKLHAFHDAVVELLEKGGQPIDISSLKDQFRQTPAYSQHQDYFEDKVIENLLNVTKRIKANPFGEYGLHNWRVVQPKDVGDKAYLVLKHNSKPLHYTVITDLINQHRFDSRTAYKETVHNELIMDPRFVLVGRGIYALSEWGYRKGLVADIIKDILAVTNEPMDREKIIEEVSKQRMVRRNTILVGLANKKLFKKIGKNKYQLA